MKFKFLTMLIGFTLITSLGFTGVVYSQSSSVIEHQTGDVLVYSTEGSHYEDHFGNFEINNLDQNQLSHYSEEIKSFSSDSTGEAMITLVESGDLNHLPPELDPSEDPEFPSDGNLYGMQIHSEETINGEDYFEKNEYNGTSDNWYNSSDTYPFGPEEREHTNFEGGISMGDFSLLPFMGDGDEMSAVDVVFGQNFSTWEYMDLPIFGDNWVEVNVTLDFEFYQLYDQSVADGNDNLVNADIYGVQIGAYGMATNISVYIPLGDESDPDTPWVQTNATVQISSSRFMEFFINRDTNNGLFLGFDETESFGLTGSLENDSARIYFPDGGNANISLYGDFDLTSNEDFTVRNTDYLTEFTSDGSNSGLETGDELHYEVDELTEIDFEDKRIIDNNPDGDGPDFDNIQYDTQAFMGTVDASQDFWASVYIHDSNSIGLIIERMYSDVVFTGFPTDDSVEDTEDGLSLDQEGDDGPLYFVEIIPLLVGETEAGGIPSNASFDVGIPVDDSRGLDMSDLLSMGNRDGEDDGGPLEMFYRLADQVGVDLYAPLSAEESHQDLYNVTINGFDYVVLGNDVSYIYELSLQGEIPFEFDDEDAPPATLKYTISIEVVDQRIYDDATGALIFKGDYTNAYINASIIADVSSFDVGYDELLVSSTSIDYSFSTEMNLESHSSDYQTAQDPADIPDDPNAEPTNTSTTEDTNATEDGQVTPELPLPSLLLPSSMFAVAFIAIYKRRLR